MVQSVYDIAKRPGQRLSKMHIWVDYSSIPQVVRHTQMGAVHSLPIYASLASLFVIVAPTATHADLDLECNLHTYSRRTWCRVECLSHFAIRGLDAMSNCTSDGSYEVTEDWLQETLLIFEGDCTCCQMKHKGMPHCDKELLVTPVLALYTHVVMEKHQSEASKRVYDVIQAQEDRMFPKTFSAQFSVTEEERIIATEKSSDASRDSKVENRMLFGSLMEDLAVEIKENRMQSFRSSCISSFQSLSNSDDVDDVEELAATENADQVALTMALQDFARFCESDDLIHMQE